MISGNDGSKPTEFTQQDQHCQETDDSSQKYKKHVPENDGDSKADKTKLRSRVFNKDINFAGARPKTKKSDFSQAFHPSRMGGEVMQMDFMKTIADQQKEIEDLKKRNDGLQSYNQTLELELKGQISGQGDQSRHFQHDVQAIGQDDELLKEQTGQDYEFLKEKYDVLEIKMKALEKENKELRKELKEPGQDFSSSSAHSGETSTPQPQDYDFLQKQKRILESRLTKTEQQNIKLQKQVEELNKALSAADERQEIDFFHIQKMESGLKKKNLIAIAKKEGTIIINDKECTINDLKKEFDELYTKQRGSAQSFLTEIENPNLTFAESDKVLYELFELMHSMAKAYAEGFKKYIYCDDYNRKFIGHVFSDEGLPEGGAIPGHRDEPAMIRAVKPALDMLIKTAGPAGALLYHRKAISQVPEEYQQYLDQQGSDQALSHYLRQCFDLCYYMQLISPSTLLSFPPEGRDLDKTEFKRKDGHQGVVQAVWPVLKDRNGAVLSEGYFNLVNT